MQQASDPCYSPDSNLAPGSWAEPGIYVASHLGPVHALVHEIIIRRPMILPHFKTCGDARFSRKCSLPQDIEASDLFFNVNAIPSGLPTDVLVYTTEVRFQVQRSNDLIRQSRQLLARRAMLPV
jgi:hypothetical protein